ncbi:MAG: segregation/condensation protein A [Patescibacteria group bacterium]
MTQDFLIKLDQFEGPLDLLLNLIEDRKLHINDISLSKVTDDFLSHVKGIEEYKPAKMAHFILIASTLLLIKSKSLLPTLSLTTDEQDDIKDLEYRLKMLQRIRDLSLNVKKNFGKNIIFQKSENRYFQPVFSPEPEINKKSLLESIKNVINSIQIKELIPQAIVKKVISIEEMISRLVDRVQTSLKTSFRDFTKNQSGDDERINIIVGFLAMLELVKQGAVTVAQQEHFADIEIETASLGVPRVI